jgi:hypothetical protein
MSSVDDLSVGDISKEAEVSTEDVGLTSAASISEEDQLLSKEDRGEDNEGISDEEGGDVAKGSLEGCCFPRKKGYRFSFLVWICLLTFGSYWCYDLPASLITYFERVYCTLSPLSPPFSQWLIGRENCSLVC